MPNGKKLPPRPPVSQCRIVSDDERAKLVAQGILPKPRVAPPVAPGEGRVRGPIPPAPKRPPRHLSSQRTRHMMRNGQLTKASQALRAG